MTEEVTKLIAESRNPLRHSGDDHCPACHGSCGTWGDERAGDAEELIARLADALERSAAQTTYLGHDAKYWHEQMLIAAAKHLDGRCGGSVAVVPEDPKPEVVSDLEYPVELPSEGSVRLEDPKPEHTVTLPYQDERSLVDAVAREADKRRAEDPKPLDPRPWEYQDGERWAAPSESDDEVPEFSPRVEDGYESDPARYGVTPKAGA